MKRSDNRVLVVDGVTFLVALLHCYVVVQYSVLSDGGQLCGQRRERERAISSHDLTDRLPSLALGPYGGGGGVWGGEQQGGEAARVEHAGAMTAGVHADGRKRADDWLMVELLELMKSWMDSFQFGAEAEAEGEGEGERGIECE